MRLIRAFGPLGRHLVAARDHRVAVNGSVAVLVAVATTTFLPLWVLAFTPLLFGVPHLIADLRYLVVRPGLHRRPWLLALAGVPIALFGVTGNLPLGLLALVGAALASRGTPLARLGTVVLGLGLVATAWATGWTGALVLAHAHNLVGVGLWWAWRKRTSPAHLVPLALYAGALALFASGAVDGVAHAAIAALPAPEVTQLAYITTGVPEPWGFRLLLAFGFAQSVHYSVWLRLVPEEDRVRESSRSVRRVVNELLDDVPAFAVLAALGLLAALFAWAFVDLGEARDGYLRLARFHGVMELAIAALWLSEGRPR